MDKELFKGKKFIGEGTSGRCYEIKTGEVVKIFKFPHDLDELERFKLFAQYQNPSILFPYDFIVKNKKFLGYVSKKASGKILDDSLKFYNLENISTHAFILERDIHFISEKGVMMYDVHRENMFYDGTHFSIIDTDGFDESVYDEESTLFKNVKKVKRAIFEVIWDELVSKNNPDFDQKLYLELLKYVTWGYGIAETILLFKAAIEKRNGASIDTLSNIKVYKR